MSRGLHNFKLNDVRRAVTAVQLCGLEVERVSVDRDGRIDVIATKKPTKRGAVVPPPQSEATA
jgi:hypothetical protein